MLTATQWVPRAAKSTMRFMCLTKSTATSSISALITAWKCWNATKTSSSSPTSTDVSFELLKIASTTANGKIWIHSENLLCDNKIKYFSNKEIREHDQCRSAQNIFVSMCKVAQLNRFVDHNHQLQSSQESICSSLNELSAFCKPIWSINLNSYLKMNMLKN